MDDGFLFSRYSAARYQTWQQLQTTIIPITKLQPVNQGDPFLKVPFP